MATFEGWIRSPSLVLDFYNQRRKDVKNAKPNDAHKSLVELERKFKVSIITQNIDNLHERAGSRSVLHLHGEIMKARSTSNENLIYTKENDIKLGDKCEKNSQLRPHIVWFGESVPKFDTALEITKKADILVVIGTSLAVYPAASLVGEVSANTPIYLIDPNPGLFYSAKIIKKKATIGVPEVVFELLTKNSL